MCCVLSNQPFGFFLLYIITAWFEFWHNYMSVFAVQAHKEYNKTFCILYSVIINIQKRPVNLNKQWDS